MKNLILILIGFWLTSCINQENLSATKVINEAIEKVAKKHNCKLTYQIILSDEKTNPLSLTLHNSVEYTAQVGSIIQDCYLELSKKDIYYDRYILKNSQGVLGLNITRKDLEKVLNCRPIAEKVINALANKKFSSVVADLDTNYFKSKDIELVQEYSQKISKDVTHIGFEIAHSEGQLYCAYIAFADTLLVNATINITENDCKIFGLKF